MATIATGVIMRHSANTAFNVCPDRTQREVHPARRDEAITYRIESDDRGLRHTTPGGESWAHYRYKFTYRYLGRTLTVTWMCGTAYGDPKPEDGLRSALEDALSAEYDGFIDWALNFGYDLEIEEARARRTYNECERMNERLDRFFGSADMRNAWHEAIEDK